MLALKKIMLVGLAAASFGAVATAASAETPWQRHHPRRVEVNHRLANQNARIAAGRREGELTARQAHMLRAEDRSIRREERIDARFDHGHITKAEQRTLNHQENEVSRQIHQERN